MSVGIYKPGKHSPFIKIYDFGMVRVAIVIVGIKQILDENYVALHQREAPEQRLGRADVFIEVDTK